MKTRCLCCNCLIIRKTVFAKVICLHFSWYRWAVLVGNRRNMFTFSPRRGPPPLKCFSAQTFEFSLNIIYVECFWSTVCQKQTVVSRFKKCYNWSQWELNQDCSDVNVLLIFALNPNILIFIFFLKSEIFQVSDKSPVKCSQN